MSKANQGGEYWAQRGEVSRTGSDLAFLVGAPGSRWSAVGFAAGFGAGVNTSDQSPDRQHPGEPLAFHHGNYFGPGMEHNVTSNLLATMRRDELRRLFTLPFRLKSGLKIIKGHVFADALEHLKQQFPASVFILVLRDDQDCLDWWLEAGGFTISYPDYSVYQEIEAIRKAIETSNRAIRDFARRMGATFLAGHTVRTLTAEIGCPVDDSSTVHVPAMLNDILATIDIAVVKPKREST